MSEAASRHVTAVPADALTIALTLDGGRVTAASITQDGRPDPGQLLSGHPVARGPGLLAALYAVCGRGQAVTGLAACESALGHAVAPAQAVARRLLVLAEAAREHARRLLIDWPAEIGVAPAPAGVRAVAEVAGRIEGALYPRGDWLRLGGGRLVPDQGLLAGAAADLRAALDAHLGLSAEAAGSVEAVHHWRRAEAHPAAQTLAVLAADAPEFGACGAPGAAAIELGAVTPAPGQTDAAADPLARQRGTPPVAEALARHGPGVFARVSAQAVELARLPAQIDALRPALAADAGVEAPATGSGKGRAAAGLSRGRLLHACRIEDGTVADYRIAAPTDAAFAPAGPVARALDGASAPTAEALERRARRLVLAFDPCASWTLQVRRSG